MVTLVTYIILVKIGPVEYNSNNYIPYLNGERINQK